MKWISFSSYLYPLTSSILVIFTPPANNKKHSNNVKSVFNGTRDMRHDLTMFIVLFFVCGFVHFIDIDCLLLLCSFVFFWQCFFFGFRLFYECFFPSFVQWYDFNFWYFMHVSLRKYLFGFWVFGFIPVGV